MDTPLPVLPNMDWSYSKLAAFEDCPMELYLTRVVGTHGPQKGKAAYQGDLTHKQMQDYVERGIEPPIGLRKLKNVVDVVTRGALEVVTEAKIGLRGDLSLCDYFARDVNVRIIIDLLAVHRTAAFVVDYKTSSAPRETPDQLRINSWLVFSRYPQVRTVYAMYAYTKFPDAKYRFDRSDWANSVNLILPRVQRMKDAFDKRQFPPTPCFKCERFCPVTECQFHGQKHYRSTHA